jgi:hypothetical protein
VFTYLPPFSVTLPLTGFIFLCQSMS